MLDIIKTFFNEWGNFLLTLVGLSAICVYCFQERRKMSEAASLITLQVNDLQERLREIQSYIVDEALNEPAFYESQIIFPENYWDKYKHYFVRKIDSESFHLFNDFYACASEVLEQQQLMKNLQKNSFFVIQNVLAQMEAGYIQAGLQNCSANPVDANMLVQGLSQSIPQNLTSEQKTAFENMIKQLSTFNANIDFTAFWNFYRLNQSNIQAVINQNGFINYIPVQIRISLEKALKKYVSLQITGSDGYKKLKKIANRKI